MASHNVFQETVFDFAIKEAKALNNKRRVIWQEGEKLICGEQGPIATFRGVLTTLAASNEEFFDFPPAGPFKIER